MDNRNNRLLFSLLTTAGLLVSQVAFAAAPVLTSSSQGTPTAADQSQISAFVQYYAQQMSTATDSHAMVRARRRLLAPLQSKEGSPSAVFLYDFGTQVATDFTPLLSEKKTALNAIITIASINDLSMQAPLQTALTNPDPAVRYWAAKGLGDISSQLLAIGPAYQEAVTAIQKALAVETDPLAAVEMCNVLLAQNPLPGNLAELTAAALKRGIANYHNVVPTNLAINGKLASDLTAALRQGCTLTAAQKRQAINTLSLFMSYSAQYWRAGLLDRNQKLSAFSAVSSAADAMNAIAGATTFSLSDLNSASNPAAVLLAVNGITGSQGQPGLVQKLFPKVGIPGRISAVLSR